MIVIFPESPQTFTWGGSQNVLFRSFAFCMTERLFATSRGKVWEGKRKLNLPPAGKRPSFIRREKFLHQNQPFIQGVSEKLLKNGEHKSPPEHTFNWRLAYFELEINNVVFPIF